jgi:23S rRNA pseudouridine1911/1915/1917 synthase
MTLHYTATPQDQGKTLFSVLHYRLRISTGQIKRLKYQTQMLVNGQPVHTDFRITPGDAIMLTLPAEHASFPPEPGHLKILYEDEAIIALHKPAGIIMHPSATRNTGTLANQLLYYLGCGTVHPVNRLDRDTTGVTIFAKNGYVKSILTETLRTASIHKTYLAPVYGSLPEDHGVIDLPIDRLTPTSLWRTIREDGQPSRTAYELLSCHGPWALYAFHPLTGRTHQIRLHCLASGAPILGDPVYCTEASRNFSDALGLTVQQLCCVEMTFPHPMTGIQQTVTTRPDFYDAPWFAAT